VIAAHGSWDPGQLPTQPARRTPRRSDLLGFKAHFLGARLERDLMPLITFPGGYGGMVTSDGGRVSVSCCVRRDTLDACRVRYPAATAGESVAAHITRSSAAAADVLAGASLEHAWRAAGPINPGVHGTYRGGAFMIGNAAGEAHPVVAEGISMAIQSAWLLAHCLLEDSDANRAREAYASAWRTTFSARIRAAAVIAHWAMRPLAVRAALPLLEVWPAILTHGARTAGKVTPIWSPSF
jgi:flavin-dependent dehydrogenase